MTTYNDTELTVYIEERLDIRGTLNQDKVKILGLEDKQVGESIVLKIYVTCKRKEVEGVILTSESTYLPSVPLPEISNYWSPLLKLDNYAYERYHAAVITLHSATLLKELVETQTYLFELRTKDLSATEKDTLKKAYIRHLGNTFALAFHDELQARQYIEPETDYSDREP